MKNIISLTILIYKGLKIIGDNYNIEIIKKKLIIYNYKTKKNNGFVISLESMKNEINNITYYLMYKRLGNPVNNTTFQ